MNDTSGKDSYRQILRSSSIIGMASVLNILFGVLRMKAVALLLGPVGVGLVGLFQNLMQTGAAVAALGMGTTGTRQVSIAAEQQDPQTQAAVRRALIWGSAVLAGCGGVLFALLGGPITTRLLGADASGTDVLWLATGMALTVLSGAQIALLTGLRRVGDVARVQVLSGMIGAAVGISVLWQFGRSGLAAMVIMAPLAAFLVGAWYVNRPGSRPAHQPPTVAAVLAQWRNMAGPGVAFMVSGLVTILGHLAVRTLVQQGPGTAALGQFQAAWAIGAMYLSFVLGAMTTDYFARLSALVGDHAAVTRLVNEQTEVALLLTGPVLLGMLAFAPWVIHLLYSAEFAPAADILRWQLLGDIFKVMSWPLGYLLLALGAGRTFILTETIGMGVFVLATAVLLPHLGVTATGPAYVLLYMAYLPAVWLVARKRVGFRWSNSVLALALALFIAAAFVLLTAKVSLSLGVAVGASLTCIAGLGGILRLTHIGAVGTRLHHIDRWLKISVKALRTFRSEKKPNE